jgi:membrane-associated phospholipid phosphatase
MSLPIWARNILFLLVYMISGLILAIIIEDLLAGADLLPLNTAIESAMVAVRTPFLTTFMVFITDIANPALFAFAALCLSAWLIMKRDIYDAILFLSAFSVTGVALTVLKNVLQISRPVSSIYNTDGWSFPSGHTTMATAFFFLLSFTFFTRLKKTRDKIFLIVGSFLGVFLAAFSRLYLGAHWMLDVLGGIALGLLSVSFTVLLFNLFFGEKKTFRKMIDL